jgi:Flp pilus assembly protein TadG
MLELALSAAVMVSFLAGTFQFGYTFYVYNQLVTAVGNGARYAATRTYRAATAQDVERGATAIRNMVVFGDARPAKDATPAVANLTANQVDVRWTKDPGGVPTAVDVSIREFSVNAVFKTFKFTGRPGVEFPYVGKYSPSENEPDPSGDKPGPLGSKE